MRSGLLLLQHLEHLEQQPRCTITDKPYESTARRRLMRFPRDLHPCVDRKVLPKSRTTGSSGAFPLAISKNRRYVLGSGWWGGVPAADGSDGYGS